MSGTGQKIENYQFAGDDVVISFGVDALDIRGRIIKAGPLVDSILKSHDYPQDVSMLLGELIMLTLILGSSLKFAGNFILQTQSDGPVSLAVVDFSTPNSVRAYARFDETALKQAINAGKVSPCELLGEGVMAMTIDQGPDMERYQGVVQLDGASLEEIAHHYFRQSEQIPTRIKLSVAQIIRKSGESKLETSWRAGGIMIQFLPGEAGYNAGYNESEDHKAADGWVEASSLMSTVSEDELTDPQIHAEHLLYRLFNEHGVRVFEGKPVSGKCSCSREKVVALMRSFKDADNPDEPVTSKCEFCSTIYEILPQELQA